jgi:hypothetical protein
MNSSPARWKRRSGSVAWAIIVIVVSVALNGGRLFAQGSAQREPPPPPANDTVSPAEIQRLFDAYVAMQAQQALQLSDEQYPTFLARIRALQAARQRGVVARGRVLQELRRIVNAPQVDESQARTQLKTLEEIDARTAIEVRDALASLDQVLDTRQQVRFRLFEEQMERRKMELVLRARQANRPKNQQP